LVEIKQGIVVTDFLLPLQSAWQTYKKENFGFFLKENEMKVKGSIKSALHGKGIH